MKKTIKRRIFTVNLLTVSLLLIITAVAFSFVFRSYLEKDTLKQLNTIARRAENAMLQRPPHPFHQESDTRTDLADSFISLMMALRVPSASINAEYALIDDDGNLITPFKDYDKKPTESDAKIIEKILSCSKTRGTDGLTFYENGSEYAAVLKPIKQPDGTKAGTLVVYSSLNKINEMKSSINFILLIILLAGALLVLLLSNYLSKGISEPLSTLNKHIKSLSELNFSNALFVPADNEIQELVQNINIMAEKLDTHNQSQKLFLQNVSHEFRTPIMSIQCHAEGILYGVVEGSAAARIIIEESKRLTHLVEEVLYLSRLDAIEEICSQEPVDVQGLLQDTCKRLASIAENKQVSLNLHTTAGSLYVLGDSEKLGRCFSNILSNAIRYARNYVNVDVSKINDKVQISVSDDGPGIDKDEEAMIFNRFYKGKKGNTGLGLAISKSIIEKLKGTITACNTSIGAKFVIELPLSNNNH
ncbi:MAG TPA: two-component sensor histidine kinase [Ruminiclostridium sp.]|nr:two-component sensor histidine kinase [Ruminiclostridium sp.]